MTLSIFQAAIAVAQAYGEYEKARQTKEWQESVSRKLDAILRNTETIIEEIRLLRPLIKEALFKERVTRFTDEIETQRTILNTTIANVGDDNQFNDVQKSIIQNVLVKTLDATITLQRYGFDGFLHVFAGYVIILTCCRILELDEYESYRKHGIEYFVSALDPQNEASFEYDRLRADIAVNAHDPFLDQFAIGPSRHGCKVGHVTFIGLPQIPGFTIDLVAWLRGDRYSGYDLRAFDTEGGIHETFFGFESLGETTDGEGRREAYRIIGIVNKMITDVNWAKPRLEGLIQTVQILTVFLETLDGQATEQIAEVG